MPETVVPSPDALALLRPHVERIGDVAVDDTTRAPYRELARAGLMVVGHSFAGGRESLYRLTKVGHDLVSASKSGMRKGDMEICPSGRPDRCVDLALGGQPGHVALLGVLLNISKKLDRLRFEARLARVVDGNDHLDLDRDDVPIGLDKPGPLDPLSGNTHGYPRSKKWTVTSFATPLCRRGVQTALLQPLGIVLADDIGTGRESLPDLILQPRRGGRS